MLVPVLGSMDFFMDIFHCGVAIGSGFISRKPALFRRLRVANHKSPTTCYIKCQLVHGLLLNAQCSLVLAGAADGKGF